MRRRHLVATAVVLIIIGTGVVYQARGGGPQRPPVPGAVSSAVTQSNIDQTICIPGYSASVRPPSGYTGAIKAQLMARVGSTNGSDWELDHAIPISIGGDPKSVDNLWLEPIDDAKAKDKYENVGHREVCAGHETLAEAQRKCIEEACR